MKMMRTDREALEIFLCPAHPQAGSGLPCGLPPVPSGMPDLLDARLVGVEQRPRLHVLGDQPAAGPRDVLPVPQRRQRQVLVRRLPLPWGDTGELGQPGQGRQSLQGAERPRPLHPLGMLCPSAGASRLLLPLSNPCRRFLLSFLLCFPSLLHPSWPASLLLGHPALISHSLGMLFPRITISQMLGKP